MSSPTDDPADLFGPPLCPPGWVVALATPAQMPGVLALRGQVFRGGADDRDSHDGQSLHLLVQAEGAETPAATLRLRRHRDGPSLLGGYAAQHYDLRALAAAGGETLELGRLCAAPGQGGGDAIRLLWGGVARVVLRTGAARLIGCTSFFTTDRAALAPPLALLGARHQGPDERSPGRRAPEVLGFETLSAAPDPAAAAALPPLLRAYLALGGWVSDHAVIDRDLGTAHVFTCVDIDTMPAARRRVLARMAEG